jgi:predicted acetyltransferase
MPTPSRNTGDSEVSETQPPLDGSRPPRAFPTSRLAWSVNGDAACLRELDHGAHIITANAGDHPLVLQLLVQSRQAPLAEDFQSRLDDPSYRPSDRLLVRRDKALLAQVHVASHIAWFEGLRVPVVKLEDLAVLPEYGDWNYHQDLIAAAESIAADEGAIMALVHTDHPDWFAARGWITPRGQGHTRASARAVLAHLDAQEVTGRRRRPNIQVRTWRHFELDAIRQIYDQFAADLWGPLFRSEASWQWLVGRKAHDQVLLATSRIKHAAAPAPLLNGSTAEDADDLAVGYAVLCGGCIVEMMTTPTCTSARLQLLARACREAMDRDHHSISLYTPAADPLHELLVTAGGAWIDELIGGGPRWMMKILSPERWVERCYPLWRHRAQTADVPRPFDLGIVANQSRYRFTLTRRSSRLDPTAGLPADRIECDGATWESLLTGNLALNAAIAAGGLRVSRRELIPSLAALFSPRLFWQSSLELMRL